MYSKKQHGKGLIAFLAGSVVALVAIALMLLTLNRTSDKAFKQPELVQKPQQPEILTPNAVPSVPITNMAQPSVSPTTTQPTIPHAASTASPVESVQKTPSNTSVKTTESVVPAERGKTPNSTFEDNMAMLSNDEPVEPVIKDKPKTPKDKNKVVATNKPPVPNEKVEDVKPTAQQILDSGNLEKAREVARREAQAKAQVTNKGANTQENIRGSVSIQAGAYGNKKAAEDQRAKLALMGVQTKVVPIKKADGTTVYRVQTNKMQGDKANQVKQTLQNNGINTYIHK